MIRLFALVAVVSLAGCDVPQLKLDKKTERELTSAAKATSKAAKKASNELSKFGKEVSNKVAKEAAKEAAKPEVEEAEIPKTALTDKGEVPLACRAVDAAGNPLAVADENRWRANARCR